MKRLLLLTLGLTMIGAAKAQEEKLEIKPSGLKCTPKVRHKTFGVHYV